MSSFDIHPYRWWPKGGGTKPLTQDFNVDSHECTLKSLELAKKLPVSFCFLRSDDDDRFPRTDDDRGPATRFVTTNFGTFADAALFFDSVCVGERALFSVVTELLAGDAPRKQSVVVAVPPDRMNTGVDMRSTLLTAVPSVIRAMASVGTPAPADEAAMFAEYSVSIVSTPLRTTQPCIIVVRNGPGRRLSGAERHADYVARVRAVAAGSSYVIRTPDEAFAETVYGVSYASVLVPRWSSSNYPSLYPDREARRVLNERGADGKVVLHSLDDASVSSHLLGCGAPRPVQGRPLQLSHDGPATLVSRLPPNSIIAKQWRTGLLKLGTMIHSDRISPETTECAEAGVYGRWTCSGGDCPLCRGECVRVDLRLMGVAGLMASCARCPPGSCPIAGPLYVSSYGALKGDHSVVVPTIVDPSGVRRMAPMSDFIDRIPPGTVIVPTGRPGSAKTHITLWHTVNIIQQNVLEGNYDRFYFHVAPFQLLVAVTRKKINNLVYDYFIEHNPVVLQALRLQGLLPSEPQASDRDNFPFLYYEDVKIGTIEKTGGFICTTANSLHKFSGLFGDPDRYGPDIQVHTRVASVTFDESETLAYMLIEPDLVNRSSVERNLLSAFKFLRLSCKANVPVFWLDGFATNEITGEFLRSAGVPFTTLDCPDLNVFAHGGRPRTLTFTRHYIRNAKAVAQNSIAAENGEAVSLHDRLKEYDVTLSVAGLIPRIIRDLERGIGVQIFNTSKTQLRAMHSLLEKHFRNAPLAKPRFFVITGDSPPQERAAANAAAEVCVTLHGAELMPICVATTSAVGGGLNFLATTHVYASIFRCLGNAQEAWQTYLRSRNLTRIVVATWSVPGCWDARLDDSFRPVTGYAEWRVAGAGKEAAEGHPEPADCPDHLYGDDAPDDCPAPEAPPPSATAADAAMAMAEGQRVAEIITRYHKLTRLVELLGPHCRGLTQADLDEWVSVVHALPEFSGGHVLSMRPKTFKDHGCVVTIVPKAPCRVWTSDDQHALHKDTWARRAVAHNLNKIESDKVTPGLYAKEAGRVKRLKTGRSEELLAKARLVSIAHEGIRIGDFSSLRAVNDLVLHLLARRQNAPAAFFTDHKAICEYMQFAQTPPDVSFDDQEVVHYEKMLKNEIMRLKEEEFRTQLALAETLSSQPPAARDAEMLELQRLSTGKKHEVSADNLARLHLLKCELAFGFGAKYWETWRAELAQVEDIEDAAERAQEMRALVKHWHSMNGPDSELRKMFSFISELTIEFEACGSNPDVLFGFTFREAYKRTRGQDIYRLGRPEVFVTAASAAMVMGWSSLLDTGTLNIEPGSSDTLAKLTTVARLIAHRVPQHCSIVSVQKIMNAALRGAGFTFHYTNLLRRRSRSTARARYACHISCDKFPDFLDANGLTPAKALGRAPLSAFLTIANHSCRDATRCGYELCPKRGSFQTFAEHATELGSDEPEDYKCPPQQSCKGPSSTTGHLCHR